MTKSLLLAGFGGQGILFAAKQIAALGMDLGKNVTWLPSYGPESRGGTSNCSVIISDEEIGSPIVNRPDCLVVFNLPSFDKFINAVAPGGEVFIDSTLVSRECERDDIKAHYIPATGLAAETVSKDRQTSSCSARSSPRPDFSSVTSSLPTWHQAFPQRELTLSSATTRPLI